MRQVPEQLASSVLPLLPLTSGVVLPGMVVTLMLETDDARAAVSAARGQGDLLVLVPKVGTRYAAVGTVSKVEDTGRLQNGMEALVIRGLHRAVIGTGVAGTGDAVWVQIREADEENVTAEYRRRIEEANMPEDVRTQAERELGRLERMSEQSPEQGWIRTYLDWLLDVPWDVRTEDNLDIVDARRILDEDHTGLQDVKERILEYLAVRKLRAERGLAETTAGRGSGAIPPPDRPPG